MNPVGKVWPKDVAEFPYLMERYRLVSAREAAPAR